MTVSKRQHIVMFIIWLLVVPFSFYFAYSYFPRIEVDWLNMLLLFGVMFIAMLLPIRFQNVTISLERLVTLTIFFQYGLFPEFVFVQLAMLILVFTDKRPSPATHKFFVNSTIFALVSIASGFVFYLSGGVVSSLKFSEIFFFGLLYAMSYSVFNILLLKLYFSLTGQSLSIFSKGAVADYISTICMAALSIALYFLHEHLGDKSLILVGIPFLTILIILRLYNNSHTLYNQLTNAGDISYKLADRLSFDEVLETFLEKLKDVVSFDNGYVVDLRGGKKLIPLIGLESGEIRKEVQGISFLEDKSSDDGLSIHHTKTYFTKKEIETLKTIRFSHPVGTVLTAPIIRNQKTEGFIILTAARKRSFTHVNMKIIDVLTGYFAISLEKARYFEETVAKSECCGLTKLHNFRYLNRRLDEEIMRFHLGEIEKLSAIILDIDHFKKINDTYGHESGNELLIKLANLLEKYAGPDDTLARYGGEEFVLILPDCHKAEAKERAEQIRQEVEQTVFSIVPDLSKGQVSQKVHMTVSLGVATIPEDAKSGQSLLRKADRALYIGGKQAGRNKVGILEDKKIEQYTDAQTLVL